MVTTDWHGDSSMHCILFCICNLIFFDENSYSVSDFNTLKHLMMHEKSWS